MPRLWTSFDSEITNKELLEIPTEARRALYKAMNAFKNEADGGFVLRNYGEGLLMLKPSNRTSGRCLFFTVHKNRGTEVAVALLFYKKESGKVPNHLEILARTRLREYREST